MKEFTEHLYVKLKSVSRVLQLSSLCKDGSQESHSHWWKGFNYAKDAGKPKNVQKVEKCTGEQWTVLKTNEGLTNNILMDHSGN